MSDIEPVIAASPRNNVSQATAVEQQRAVAEVQAMVVVAQQVPRDLTTAVNQMRESCNMKALAQRAFFRFPRGGDTITGPTVHLARELARCFGNVTYGLTELRRDDDEGVSEMQAFAWDLETNTRTSSTFMVPHRRDTRGGPQALVETRDIYENNANQGARRVREAIFAILPPWYVEEAKALCAAALERDEDGKPLATRIANTVNAFERKFEVTVDQLEAKLGRPRKAWTGVELATLEVVGASLARGEVTLDEEFEPRRVTGAEITGSPAPAAAPPVAASPTGSGDAGEGGVSDQPDAAVAEPPSPASTSPAGEGGEPAPAGDQPPPDDEEVDRAAGPGKPATGAGGGEASDPPSPEPAGDDGWDTDPVTGETEPDGDDERYDVLAHLDDTGVKWSKVINEIIKDWPSNDQHARPRPTKKALTELVASRPDMVGVVRSIVDEFAEAGDA